MIYTADRYGNLHHEDEPVAMSRFVQTDDGWILIKSTRKQGQPKTDIERVMTHYDVDEKTAKKMLATKSVDELLPARGAGLNKSTVRAHTRKTKTGKIANVKQYQNTKQKQEKMTPAKVLNEIWSALNKAGDYLKIKNEPYMPLSLDQLGSNRFAMGHNYIQEGDVMADPDMEVKVNSDGTFTAMHYQQDNMGIFWPSFVDGEKTRHYQGNQEFLNTWCKNLAEQGFMEKLNNPKLSKSTV